MNYASARHIIDATTRYRRAWTLGDHESERAIRENLRAIRVARPASADLISAILSEPGAEEFRREERRSESERHRQEKRAATIARRALLA